MIIPSRKLINSLRKCIPVIAMMGFWCFAVFATNGPQTAIVPTNTQLTDEIQLVSTASVPEAPQVEENTLVVQLKTAPSNIQEIVQTSTEPTETEAHDVSVKIETPDADVFGPIEPTLLKLTPANIEPEETEEEVKEEIEVKIDPKQTPTSDGFVYLEKIPLSKELQRYTYDTCIEQNVRYTMVLAIMRRESGYDINATHYNTNGTMDSGAMQLNDVMRPFLKDQYGIVDLMDPYENIRGGTSFIRYLLNKYDERSAMMAYQYGEGGMASKHSQGIYTSEAVEKMYRFEAEIIQMMIDVSNNTSTEFGV